jgi:multidrug resistance protein, MATE family
MELAANKDLLRNVSYKDIFKTALPLIVAALIPQINFVTNNLFFSHLGESQMGFGLLTGVYYLLFSTMGYALNNGSQAIMARRSGETDVLGLGNVFKQAWFLNMAIAVLGIVITYTLGKTIFSFNSHIVSNASNLNEVMQFVKVRTWGLPFMYTFILVGSFLIATNNAKYIVIITLLETIANIGLDYALIFGKFGFKEYGFLGAAYASVWAEIIAAITGILLIILLKMHKRFGVFSNIKIQWPVIRNILQQALPLIFQHIISIGSWFLFFFFVSDYGERALSVSSVMRNIFGLSSVCIFAFASTTNTMVSNVIGQQKNEWVPIIIRRILLLNISVSTIIALALNLFPAFFVGLFNGAGDFNQDVLPVLRVVSTATILMSISIILIYASTGTGNALINLLAEIFAIVLYIGYSYFTAKIVKAPLYVLWLNEYVYWISIFVIVFPYLYSNKWKNKKI